jgi:ABC-type Fe3+/spermidine/putrescine transport system ATPase subunit
VTELHVSCDAPVGNIRLCIDATLRESSTALFGPSGSGKSSLLRIIAGLWTPRGTQVWMDGEDLSDAPPHRRRIALVAQEPALFPHMSVMQNIRFGIRSRNSQRLGAMLDLFDLRPLQHARVAGLSGGERKRVAMARALASDPALLLLDEVFTGMHRSQRGDLVARVREFCKESGIGILSVTHDPVEALLLNDMTFLMEDGSIVAQGTPRDVLSTELAGR